MRYLVSLALVLALCIPAAAQNAGYAWNCNATGYHFGTYPAPSFQTTFADAYTGDPCCLESDLQAIAAAVAQTLASAMPEIDGNDLMNATLNNWPD